MKRFEYSTKTNRGVTTYQPHIGLVTLHEDIGDDEKLFLGELAALEQAIHHRIAQKEYKNKSLFPVRFLL